MQGHLLPSLASLIIGKSDPPSCDPALSGLVPMEGARWHAKVRSRKRAVRMCGDADLASARNIGLEALAMLIGGKEWHEGMAAFMEKRTPRFPPLT